MRRAAPPGNAYVAVGMQRAFDGRSVCPRGQPTRRGCARVLDAGRGERSFTPPLEVRWASSCSWRGSVWRRDSQNGEQRPSARHRRRRVRRPPRQVLCRGGAGTQPELPGRARPALHSNLPRDVAPRDRPKRRPARRHGLARPQPPGDELGCHEGGRRANHAGNAGGHSFWWTWTAPATRQVTVSLAGSSFDTLLGVYLGTAVSALTQVAANDDTNGELQSQVTFSATAGQVYRIAVDGYAGAAGTVTRRDVARPLTSSGDLISTGGSTLAAATRRRPVSLPATTGMRVSRPPAGSATATTVMRSGR